MSDRCGGGPSIKFGAGFGGGSEVGCLLAMASGGGRRRTVEDEAIQMSGRQPGTMEGTGVTGRKAS